MTETKTLYPCQRCQSDLVTCWQHSLTWRAGCRNCGIQTAGHNTEEGAIADWNQSYAAWTTEVPAENGDYWLEYPNDDVQVVRLYGNAYNRQMINLKGHRWMLAQFCKDYPNARWSKVIPPSMSESDNDLKNATLDEDMWSHCQYCGLALVNRTVCKQCTWRVELKKEGETEVMPMI